MCHLDKSFKQRKMGKWVIDMCLDWYVFHIIISYSKYKGPDIGAFLVSFKELLVKTVG